MNEYHADDEFKNIEACIILSTLHTQEIVEHDPTMEQNIMTPKDRTGSTVHLVPYKKMMLLIIDFIS